MMGENYQKKLEQILMQGEKEQKQDNPKRLLLHSCCAPCSSYVLEYLSEYFAITVFYYNPNIAPEAEYRFRVEEQKRLIASMPFCYPVDFAEGSYDVGKYYDAVKGYEKEKEGGARCFICYELRLREAASMARDGGYDYFTTTLSISPMKHAAVLNKLGSELAAEYDIPYLWSDFKKKDGYKRSIELSKEYNLYRQNYCGCLFSK